MVDQHDNCPTDEEGLRLHYDVILVGTGLVQSILASALARAGKSVLHTDCGDFYGELDAVWTLPYLESQKELGDKSFLFGSPPPSFVSSTENDDNQPSLSNLSIPLSPRGSFHDMKLHSMGKIQEPRPRRFTAGDQVRIPTWGPATVLGWQIPEKATTTEDSDLLKEQPEEKSSTGPNHRLVLELTNWKLANGKYARLSTIDLDKIVTMREVAAEEILNRRSRSFAIDVSPGLIWAQGPAVLGLLQSSVSEYVEFKSLEKLWWYDGSNSKGLQAVPCSKNDVFASALLSPMEKRRLMKFLQLALDFSVAEAEAAEQAAVDGKGVDGVPLPAAWETLNERHLNQGRSLARPQNKSVESSGVEALQKCIRDEMDFKEYLTSNAKLSPKLAALVRYALALDFGTHKMSVGEGMNNLGQHLQSLGRFGATAFLVPLFGSGELSQAFCRSAAVYGATYLLRRSVESVKCSESGVIGVMLRPYTDSDDTTTPANNEASSKLVKSSHVVVPDHAIMQTKPKSKLRIMRRVSIVSGRPTEGSVRHAVLLPPGALQKSKHPHTIHGLWFDESINVTPITNDGRGCSILHLTTAVDTGTDDESILQEAIETILENSSVYELYQISFSYPLYNIAETNYNIQGVNVIQRPQLNLAIDTAFEQAHQIFNRICPDVAFLGLSKEIDDLVKERFGDRNDEDDEQVALSNALNLLCSSEKTSQPLFIWLGDVDDKGDAPHRLLLPVPRLDKPSISSLDVDSINQQIREHCSSPDHDPRVYFSTCTEVCRDTLEFTQLMKKVIELNKGRDLRFEAFSNGVSGDIQAVKEVGLTGIQVSLFAPDAKAYSEATGLSNEYFMSACDNIRQLVSDGVSVEIGLLQNHAGDGRVFARSLGAKEVHLFAA
jgi:RAB protein geranylgeranyltransferase component A